MNRMLKIDLIEFKKKFQDAMAFITAAHNRYECYCLARNPIRNEWKEKRLEELSAIPSCQDDWFKMLIEEGQENGESQ